MQSQGFAERREMENTIIYLTLWAGVATGLLLIAILMIFIQRKQLFEHEDHIAELTRKQDIFPDPAGSIHLNSLKKEPKVMNDWTLQKLKNTQRFYYLPALWRNLRFNDYQPRIKTQINKL